MDKFLEKYNQNESETLSRQIKTNEIEEVIKKHPANQTSDPDGFTGEFYPTIQEKLTPLLLKIFQKFQGEGILTSSLYEASIILIPKLDKYTTKRRKL